MLIVEHIDAINDRRVRKAFEEARKHDIITKKGVKREGYVTFVDDLKYYVDNEKYYEEMSVIVDEASSEDTP